MNKKAQSALEYLLTYGWAILIIGVVLVSLFALGIFNSASFVGNNCLFSSGFICKGESLNHATGTLTFVFGQSTGDELYDLSFACAASTNSSTGFPLALPQAFPNNPSGTDPWQPINAQGGAFNPQYSRSSMDFLGANLQSGSEVTISNLTCYDTNGDALPRIVPIGTQFSGHLFVAYNSQPTNPWYYYPRPVSYYAANHFKEIGSITVQSS